MKTVYLVEKSAGEWDDRANWVDRVYFNKEEAELYISKYNEKLLKLKKKLNAIWEEKMDSENYGDIFFDRWNRINDLNGCYLRESKLYE